MRQPVDVAVAILLRADGSVLLAQRPLSKVYAGYWEFPGGKVEGGETVFDALVREIAEELKVRVEAAVPWVTQVYTYPHATVRLHFFRVFGWQGEPHPVEHQGLMWQRPEAVTVAPLLPANGPVLKGLQLPEEYAITQAAALGPEVFLRRLHARLEAGLRLIQVREKQFKGDVLEDFASRVIALARPYGARVLVNSDIALAQRVGADGVHLSASQLAAMRQRPELTWCAASCHTQAELRLAERLGADFAVLGPVLETPSHPDITPLGWEQFATLLAGSAIPVYALGGMSPPLLDRARQCGAHGIAMLRGSWR